MSEETHYGLLTKKAKDIFEEKKDYNETRKELFTAINLNEELTAEAVKIGCDDAIRKLMALHRTSLKRQTTSQILIHTPEEHKRVQEVTKKFSPKFYTWPLPGGLILGDARMHDLDAAMLRFRQNARGNEINARFLEKVRDNLKNASQRVRDVYKKEVELARLYQEAMKSVDEGYEKQGGHIADIQRIKRETKA